MTHILITDLREIRYMAYVPEEPNWSYYNNWYKPFKECEQAYAEALEAYESALEKAKRESVPFDLPEDQAVIFLRTSASYGSEAPPKPGIYQVPVEVEVVNICNVSGLPGCADNDKSCLCAPVKVARLKSSEPKEESQEEIVQAFFMEYNRLIQGGRPQYSAAMKLLDKFSITRNSK